MGVGDFEGGRCSGSVAGNYFATVLTLTQGGDGTGDNYLFHPGTGNLANQNQADNFRRLVTAEHLESLSGSVLPGIMQLWAWRFFSPDGIVPTDGSGNESTFLLRTEIGTQEDSGYGLVDDKYVVYSLFPPANDGGILMHAPRDWTGTSTIDGEAYNGGTLKNYITNYFTPDGSRQPNRTTFESTGSNVVGSKLYISPAESTIHNFVRDESVLFHWIMWMKTV